MSRAPQSSLSANPTPILFFDRDVGTALPRALRILLQSSSPRLPSPVEFHQDHFPANATDDVWMPVVGRNGWILIGHDRRHHRRQAELAAIKQYGMACFYLWGGDAPRWEKMLCFLRSYDKLLKAAASTPRPFIYRIAMTGLLTQVPVP